MALNPYAVGELGSFEDTFNTDRIMRAVGKTLMRRDRKWKNGMGEPDEMCCVYELQGFQFTFDHDKKDEVPTHAVWTILIDLQTQGIWIKTLPGVKRWTTYTAIEFDVKNSGFSFVNMQVVKKDLQQNLFMTLDIAKGFGAWLYSCCKDPRLPKIVAKSQKIWSLYYHLSNLVSHLKSNEEEQLEANLQDTNNGLRTAALKRTRGIFMLGFFNKHLKAICNEMEDEMDTKQLYEIWTDSYTARHLLFSQKWSKYEPSQAEIRNEENLFRKIVKEETNKQNDAASTTPLAGSVGDPNEINAKLTGK